MTLYELKNKRLLIALSGGIDSVYMYHLIASKSYLKSLDMAIVHVNYNTSEHSIDAYHLCRELAIKNKHKFYYKSVKISSDKNFENEARIIRYNLFQSIAIIDKYDHILVGHNKNDLIETLWMKNYPSDDYASIPFSRNDDFIFRPLLSMYRYQIEKEVEQKKYHFIEDPSNKDVSFQRNKIRHEILPKLTDKDKILSKIMNCYEINFSKYRDSIQFYKKCINKHIFFGTNILIEREFASKLSIKKLKLFIQASINNHYKIFCSKSNIFWSELLGLIKSDKNDIYKLITNRIIIYLSYDYIKIYNLPDTAYCNKITDGSTWLNYQFSLDTYMEGDNIQFDKNIFLLPKEKYDEGLYVRKWQDGDFYKISNNHKKLVSKLFNDKKINKIERSSYPVIFSNNSIVWIPGLAHSNNNYSNYNNLLAITCERKD